MNYAEMSGYEINNRLHNVIACEGKYDLKVEGYKVTWTDKETGRVIETLRKQYDKEFKDYLSSWANAGPIIEANKIAMIPEGDGTWFALGNPQIKSNWRVESTGSFHNDTTPLRAAMIVFLMMQEKPNA